MKRRSFLQTALISGIAGGSASIEAHATSLYTGGALIVSTVQGLVNESILPSTDALRFDGYETAGDRGAWPLAIEVENQGKLQPWERLSNGGARRWRLVAQIIRLEYFGANGSAQSDTVAAIAAGDLGDPVDLHSGTYQLNDDVTFRNNVRSDGATITIAKGKTLTFKGIFEAPRSQAFFGTGTVAGLKAALAEWYIGSYTKGGPNSGTDCTLAMTAFMSAVDAGTASGFVPDGDYHLSDGFIFYSSVLIWGSKQANFHNINPALKRPVFDLTAAAAKGSILDGFQISSLVAVDSPDAVGVRLGLGQNTKLKNLEISGLYSGIRITADQSGAWVENNFVHNTVSHGYDIDAANLSVSANYALFCGGDGFRYTTISGGSGGLIHERNTSFQSGGHGHNFQGNSIYGIGDLIVRGNVNSYSPNGRGFNLDTYSKNTIFSDNFTEGAGMTSLGGSHVVSVQNGIHFTKNNHNVSISNNQTAFSSGSGESINFSYFSHVGGDYTANNTSGRSQNSGITIGEEGVPVTNFSIVAPKTGHKPGADVFYQQYGILFIGRDHSGVVLASTLEGVIGPIGGLVDSPTVNIEHCPGYRNEVFGTATISAGSSAVVVTHGLAAAPIYVGISVRDAIVDRLWYGTVGTKTFSINVATNVKRDTFINYHARC